MPPRTITTCSRRRRAQRLVDAFVRLTGLPPGARVADLGCGSGTFTALLARAGYDCVGLDISAKLIAVGRRKHPDIEFLEGDIEHLPFPDASFDGVLLSGVVHHFPDPSRCAAEVFRVLRPQRTVRRLRSQSHESVHVALSRPRVAVLQLRSG